MGCEMVELMREKAEVYKGELECQKRSLQLLDEFGIPRGLLPLSNIVEMGLVRSEGFLWLKQEKRKNHFFQKIGRLVSFAPEITAFVEPRRLSKLTGVKAKELLVWVAVTEMVVEKPPAEKVWFKTSTGISRSFPISAFV